MCDTKYWEKFYQGKPELNNCSDFCKFILDYFKDNYDINTILDAGCGNGRDSQALCKKYKVTGVDNCGFKLENSDKFTFQSENFISMDKSGFDLIYSRFTLHSITNNDHQKFLKSIKPNTYLVIEARSSKDMDKDEYYGKTHYRNYIELSYLENILRENNFKIYFIKEDINFAKYKSENPSCIRVICKRQNN